jgi:hypothetical protein
MLASRVELLGLPAITLIRAFRAPAPIFRHLEAGSFAEVAQWVCQRAPLLQFRAQSVGMGPHGAIPPVFRFSSHYPNSGFLVYLPRLPMIVSKN